MDRVRIGSAQPSLKASLLALRKRLQGMHNLSLTKLSTFYPLNLVDSCSIQAQNCCGSVRALCDGVSHTVRIPD
jgi:hypothetical protein